MPAGRVGWPWGASPGSTRAGSADLDLGAVQPHNQSFGRGVGQHVGQGVQPHPRRGGEAPAGQQRGDLTYRGGDGGAVHAVEHRQSLVRQGQPQPGQGAQHPVAQGQGFGVSGAGPAVTIPVAASAVQAPFPGGCEWFGKFGDEPVQVVAGDAGEDRMRQGRTGLLDRHKSVDRAARHRLDQADTPGHINTPLLIPRS